MSAWTSTRPGRPRSRGGRLGGLSATRLWLLNLVPLVAFLMWALVDPLFDASVQGVRGAFAKWLEGTLALAGLGGVLAESWRAVAITVLAGFGAVGLSGLLVGLWAGSRDSRTLKAMIVLTTFIGGWLALSVHSSEIAWQGKRLRIASRLDAFEALAGPLRAAWPSEDGVSERLGPFMAYPAGSPSTLILLTPPEISASAASVSAVERTEAGGLLFQLSGLEAGAWVEWHPADARPRSFVGGLGDPHRLIDSLRLGDGWHLARYE